MAEYSGLNASGFLRPMARWLVAMVLSLAAVAAYSESPPPAPRQSSTALPNALASKASEVEVVSAAASAVVSQPDVTHLTTKFASLEASVSRIEDKLPSIWWLTPVTTLLSVVVGGLISGLVARWTQSRLLNHQEQMARFDWNVKQFTELYGPLRTLFDGSNEVYRRMNEALIHQNPSRYRDLTLTGKVEVGVEVDPDGRYFEVFDEQQNSWRKFRMIMDWSSVYGQGLGVDGYFDRIVDIGRSISKLIQEKAGLVMPHHGELLAAFGRYLAHFEVLRELHTRAQPAAEAEKAAGTTKDTPLKVREAAAFPNSIQKLVREGANELLAKLSKA